MTGSTRLDYPAALSGCLETCRRCAAVLDAVERQTPVEARSAFSVVGPHLRHCLDHFRSLLRGVVGGEVDYDARERETPEERDLGRCREALDEISGGLRALRREDPARPLRVRQAAAGHGESAVVDSNLERELLFLSGHTIHHIAIIAAVARAHGISIPEDLAVAFSTAAHRRSVEAGTT